jgi:tetratricopeptide (TPR) repeat protein
VKRRLLLLLAGSVALFALIGVLRTLSSDKEEASSTTPGHEAERRRVASFWKLYQDATKARMQGDFATAVGLYRRALALKPDHEDSIYYLGNCFFETGDYRQAAEQYRRITRLNPRSQRAFSQLGVTLSTLDPAAPFDPVEAEASFRKSIAINGEESGPFLRLGLLALKAGDPASALRNFRTAAGFRSPEGYFQAGSILFSQGRYREAAGMFREVLRMNAREKAISGRGVLSEGDIQSSRKMLTPVEASGLKALLYLAWADDRLDDQAEDVDQTFRIHLQNAAIVGPGLMRVPRFDRLMGQATRVAWGDFDRDHDLDLAVLVPSGKIALYSNTDGRLAENGPRLGIGKSRVAGDIAWGDYDGDGRLDLFAAGGDVIEPGEVTLYRNTGHGFADVTGSAGLAGTRMTLRIWVGDLDLDGKPDLLEAGSSEGALPPVRFYRNLGKSVFREASREAGLTMTGSATDCLVEDFNSDRLPDVVIMRWKRPSLLFLAVKPGQFARPLVLENTPRDGYSCVTADFNRDSHPDLLFTAHAPYELAAQNLIKPDLGWPVQTPRLLLGDGRGDE